MRALPDTVRPSGSPRACCRVQGSVEALSWAAAGRAKSAVPTRATRASERAIIDILHGDRDASGRPAGINCKGSVVSKTGLLGPVDLEHPVFVYGDGARPVPQVAEVPSYRRAQPP